MEQIFGWGVYNRLRVLPDLPVTRVREWGRFVKNQRLSGLEGWVRLPGAKVVVPPPRWKVAVVTWVAILPVIEVLSALFFPRLTAWPWYARPVALTLVMIPLMTWVVMPAATRLARPFLYPR